MEFDTSASTGERDPIELARKLVQLEIDNKSGGVAGPIDVLAVTAAGPSWINKKSNCPQASNRLK
jgi:hypothetical protein